MKEIETNIPRVMGLINSGTGIRSQVPPILNALMRIRVLYSSPQYGVMVLYTYNYLGLWGFDQQNSEMILYECPGHRL